MLSRIIGGFLIFLMFICMAIMIYNIVFVLRSGSDLANDSTNGFLIFFGVALAILMTYSYRTRYLRKSNYLRDRSKGASKSRFIFTKEGEIIEVVDDEKRKRGAGSKVE